MDVIKFPLPGSPVPRPGFVQRHVVGFEVPGLDLVLEEWWSGTEPSHGIPLATDANGNDTVLVLSIIDQTTDVVYLPALEASGYPRPSCPAAARTCRSSPPRGDSLPATAPNRRSS